MARRTKDKTTASRSKRKSNAKDKDAKPDWGKRALRAGVHGATSLATGTTIQTLDALGYEREANIVTGVLAAGGLVAQMASEGQAAQVLGTAGNAALAVGGGRMITRRILKASGQQPDQRAFEGEADASVFADDFDAFHLEPFPEPADGHESAG